MEKLSFKVSFQQKEDAIKCHELFFWKLEKEEKVEPNIYRLDFIREEIEHLEEIKKLEKNFFKTSSIPLWLLIVIPVVAIIYITTFFILFQTKALKADQLSKALIISLPTSLLLFTSMGLTYLRNKQIQKYYLNHEQRIKIYEDKIKELNNGK